MPTCLAEARLRSGEMLRVIQIEPPVGDYRSVIDAVWRRGPTGFGALVSASLAGDLLEQTHDVYLFGEIDGAIVARMGYITPADTRDVGTYGFVHTHPDHRRKGISTLLLDHLLRTFTEQDGIALHLATGNPVAHHLYEKHGFVDVGTPRIMRFVHPHAGAGDFERDYFAADSRPCRVRPVHWGDYPRLEALYSVFDHPWLIRDYPRGIWQGDRKNAYEDEGLQVMALQQDGKGAALVLENALRRVVGCASLIATPVYAGCASADFDLFVMPGYFHAVPDLLDALMHRARLLSLDRLECWVFPGDVQKRQALIQAGFQRIGEKREARLIRNDGFSMILYAAPTPS